MEGKHDIYLMYLTKEEITTSEKWIDELQEEYNGALTVNAKYGNEKQLIEQKEKEELNRQHVMKLREEEFQRIVQQTIINGGQISYDHLRKWRQNVPKWVGKL